MLHTNPTHSMFKSIVVWILCMNVGHVHSTRQDVGVGIDFNPSYGAVAVSYGNGTNVELARVNGDRAWTELMWDISANESPLAPFAKLSNVRILSSMIRLLVDKAEVSFGQPITAVAASFPASSRIPRDTTWLDQLTRESFEAAGVEYIQLVRGSYSGEPMVFVETAVVAGHNLSLCQPYTSTKACVRKPDGSIALPWEAYYLVGYYEDALEVIVTTEAVVAYGLGAYPTRSYELGARMRHRNPDEKYYWEAVRDQLSKPLVYVPWRKPTRVVLYGDQSREPRFRALVREVLRSFFEEEDMPDWIDDAIDPTYAAAYGIAELTKRKPYWDTELAIEDQNSLLRQQGPL